MTDWNEIHCCEEVEMSISRPTQMYPKYL